MESNICKVSKRDERVKALEEFVRKWNRTHKAKIRVIGGFAKKGYSKHDIDILLTKHLPHNIEVKLAQKILKVTGLNRVDIFNPITKAELKALKKGSQGELGVFGWEALPEQYKPDYIITSYNPRGVPISKGRMAKKDLQRFDYRVRVLAYRDALRKYVLRKVYEKYGYSKLPKKVLKLLSKIRREEQRDEELLNKWGISRKRVVKVQQEMGLVKGGMYVDTTNLKRDARRRYFKNLRI